MAKERSTYVPLDSSDDSALKGLISNSDIVISLLPATMHVAVAKACLALSKHLVTASYISDQMRELDEEARGKGLLFLNEIGLDPGLDHMSAKAIIDKVHDEGGRVCACPLGLPAGPLFSKGQACCYASQCNC